MNLSTAPATTRRSRADAAARRQADSTRRHPSTATSSPETPTSAATESTESSAPEPTSSSAWPFERIYDEYKVPIYNYIFHLVGNRELADDLTQDTFLKAFKALPRMDRQLKLSAWLYRIATNTAYDALRRRKLITWTPWQEMDREPADEEHSDPQDMLDSTSLVREALEQMPEHYRAALLLYTQEGFSYSEIATALNMAESGVKMCLTRARQSFREHFRSLEQRGGKASDV